MKNLKRVEELLVEYYAAVTDGVDGYDYTSGDLAGSYAKKIAATLGGELDAQAIADELNAELGSGTCNPVETEVITYYDEYGHDAVKVHVMECDECGGTYEHINGDYERCPRCGEAVKR